MTLFEEILQISRDGWAARAAARTASAAAIRAARAVARSASPAASRAARLAASRSARSAALAVSRAARKAAVDAAEAARGASVIRCFDFKDQEEERRRIRAGITVPAPTRRVPGVVVTDKDMETDEALWALYEQWCKALNKVREHSDMVSRFKIFKETAESVLSHNKAHEGMPEKHIVLGKYADGYDAKDMEYIAKCKEAIVEGGCSHLLSSIDSSLPTPLVNSSP